VCVVVLGCVCSVECVTVCAAVCAVVRVVVCVRLRDGVCDVGRVVVFCLELLRDSEVNHLEFVESPCGKCLVVHRTFLGVP
jgi:hypothetical protein